MKNVISTDKAPAAIGPYSQAIEVNGMVYTSGIIPVVPATGEIPEGSVAHDLGEGERFYPESVYDYFCGDIDRMVPAEL